MGGHVWSGRIDHILIHCLHLRVISCVHSHSHSLNGVPSLSFLILMFMIYPFFSFSFSSVFGFWPDLSLFRSLHNMCSPSSFVSHKLHILWLIPSVFPGRFHVPYLSLSTRLFAPVVFRLEVVGIKGLEHPKWTDDREEGGGIPYRMNLFSTEETHQLPFHFHSVIWTVFILFFVQSVTSLYVDLPLKCEDWASFAREVNANSFPLFYKLTSEDHKIVVSLDCFHSLFSIVHKNVAIGSPFTLHARERRRGRQSE